MIAALTTCLFAVASALGAGDGSDVPFEAFGKSFLKARAGAEQVDALPIDALWKDHCARLDVGLFEIGFPQWSLAEKSAADDLRALALALVDTETHWIQVHTLDDPAAAAPKADAQALATWIKGWKAPALTKVATLKKGADLDLFAALAAPDDVRAAAKRLGETLLKPDLCGVAPKDGKVQRLLFAPKRLDFIQLIGYAGLLDKAKQTELWNKDSTSFTSFWIDWYFVLALEYPPWNYDPKFESGLSMNRFEKTGMLEHTLQQALGALNWSCWGDPGEARYFLQARAMRLAIEVCGELNALEGDAERGTNGAQTQPYEKFVPGGNPDGGTLPAMPAAPFDSARENHWREGKGADWFALPLRKGQKLGQKQVATKPPEKLDKILARDKNAHFQLLSADGAEKYVVSAPFLGKYTKDKQYPPGNVLIDYREFFRSYKCAFYHWLGTEFDPKSPAESAKKERELVQKLAAKPEGKSYEDLVQEVYGLPLSGKNGETPSLEWRFLEWLAKGK